MTGMNFSPASPVEARRLADELRAGVDFVDRRDEESRVQWR